MKKDEFTAMETQKHDARSLQRRKFHQNVDMKSLSGQCIVGVSDIFDDF